jgi:hypothetical protein
MTATLWRWTTACPAAGTKAACPAAPDGRVRGRLDQPGQLELPQFDLLLADATQRRPLTGSATWQDHALNLQAQLTGVTPQRLDSRAAAMQLSGPVTLAMRACPRPTPAATSKAPPSVPSGSSTCRARWKPRRSPCAWRCRAAWTTRAWTCRGCG